MFSSALEMVLEVAVREAVARRHGHLTLEHLLYAAANHPAGEEILRACAVDLDRLRGDLSKYLEDRIERLPKGVEQEPSQTLAFRRVLQAAVLHVQSAGREEANVGEVERPRAERHGFYVGARDSRRDGKTEDGEDDYERGSHGHHPFSIRSPVSIADGGTCGQRRRQPIEWESEFPAWAGACEARARSRT